jgi:deaminated glutathione amidase
MKIAVLQMTSGIDPAVNQASLVDAVAAAAQGGAVMLFTPEMSGLVDSNRSRARDHVFTEDRDPVLAAVRAAAAEQRIWVHIGSLMILRDDGKLANRGFVIDDQGAIRARYDKMHLFDVDLPTGESWRESAAYTAGEAPTVVATPAGALGLSICYDMRFPDLYRALTDDGATILAMPAAFTRPTGKAHWHILLRARAIEGAAFVVAAAQTGQHEDGRATYGHSLVIDTWGEVLLDMGEAPGIGFADLDLAHQDDVRQRVPALKHRRAIPAVAHA